MQTTEVRNLEHMVFIVESHSWQIIKTDRWQIFLLYEPGMPEIAPLIWQLYSHLG